MPYVNVNVKAFMPTTSNFYLPSRNWPGSSGYSTGGQFPSIYASYYDPVTGQVRSSNPTGQYDIYGRLRGATTNAAGVNPYAAIAGGYSTVPMPGTGGANPATVGSKELLSSGYNPNAAPGQGYNPFFTVANTKSPDIQAQIDQQLADLNTLRTQNPTQLITDAMKAADPAYKQYLQQETGAVGDWYNGVNEGKFAANTAEGSAAYAKAMDIIRNQRSRDLALQQMGQGGGAALGGNSYLNSQALDTISKLVAQQGLYDTAQKRQDLMTLLAGQQQNLGTRAGLTTGDINRQLLPSQVSAQWFNQLLQALTGLSQNQLANNFYGLGQQGQSGGAPTMVWSTGVPNSTPIRNNYGANYSSPLMPYANPASARARLLGTPTAAPNTGYLPTQIQYVYPDGTPAPAPYPSGAPPSWSYPYGSDYLTEPNSGLSPLDESVLG